MKGSVKGVEELHYARVKRVHIELDGGSMSIEIPQKVLDDAGWTPAPGDKVEVEIRGEAPENLDEWDIVMGGYVYLKKEEQSSIYASMGGLKMVVAGEEFYGAFNVDDKVYLALRLAGKT